MTREEEIIQAADECYPTWEEHSAGFYQGAKWADQNPRKGLWDSEKVTEWLENHVREFKYYDNDFADGSIDADGLIETLTKAMEE